MKNQYERISLQQPNKYLSKTNFLFGFFFGFHAHSAYRV